MKQLFVIFISLFISLHASAQNGSEQLYQQAQTHFNDQQYGQAITLLQQAAKAKHAKAQFLLGVLYLEGKGVEANPKRAFKWTAKAAAQKHYDATLQLAEMYEKGIGVEKDETKAKQLLSRLSIQEIAEPVGGMKAFYNYLKQNLRYPAEAVQMGIEGKVFLSFIVEEDGTLSNIKVNRGIGGGCDEEAVRLIKNSPKWKPGTWKGQPMKQRMNIPIGFALK